MLEEYFKGDWSDRSLGMKALKSTAGRLIASPLDAFQ